MGDVEGEARCLRGGGCGARVRWVLTVNHRRLDLDVEPTPAGNVIITDLPDGRIRAKVLCGPEMPAQQEAFRMHACPRPDRPGPRCSMCLLPMHRDLTYLLGWTTHPCCDPGFQRELAKQLAAEGKSA